MKTDDVVAKLRALKLRYARDKVWQNGVALANELGEFEAYLTILYSHNAQAASTFERRSQTIAQEELAEKAKYDIQASKPSERRSMDEVSKRIDIRLAALKAQLKMLELEVKGGATHVSTMQSLLKNFNDEAKGIR